MSAPRTLAELLADRAAHAPDRPAVTVVEDGTRIIGELTYAQLAGAAGSPPC